MIAYKILNVTRRWLAGGLCATQLVACGSASPPTPIPSPTSGPQALIAAAKADDVAAVATALRTGIDPNLREDIQAQWNLPESANRLEVPLLVAVREGHVEAAEALLKAGADPNLREGGLEWGETPLMHASRTGKAQLVSLLLRYRADPRLRYGPFQAKERITNSGDALLDAVIFGHVASVELLLISGASATTEHLAQAIARGQTGIAYLLLSAGADPRAVAYSGRTAIQQAALLPGEQRKDMTAMINDFLRGDGPKRNVQ